MFCAGEHPLRFVEENTRCPKISGEVSESSEQEVQNWWVRLPPLWFITDINSRIQYFLISITILWGYVMFMFRNQQQGIMTTWSGKTALHCLLAQPPLFPLKFYHIRSFLILDRPLKTYLLSKWVSHMFKGNGCQPSCAPVIFLLLVWNVSSVLMSSEFLFIVYISLSVISLPSRPSTACMRFILF